MICEQNSRDGSTGWSIWCWSYSWVGLGWLWFCLFYLLPCSAWADGKLAEVAKEVGNIVEHHRSNITQPNYLTRRTTVSTSVDLFQVSSLWSSQFLHKFVVVGNWVGTLVYCTQYTLLHIPSLGDTFQLHSYPPNLGWPPLVASQAEEFVITFTLCTAVFTQ